MNSDGLKGAASRGSALSAPLLYVWTLCSKFHCELPRQRPPINHYYVNWEKGRKGETPYC